MHVNVNILKSKINIFSLLFLAVLVGLSFFVQSAFADSYTLSGRVSDSSGNNITGATVTVTDSTTNATVGNTITDSGGNYSIDVTGGKYNVKVTPSSDFSPVTAFMKTISADTVLNFAIVPAGTVTLSGRILDPLGSPLPNLTVRLQASGTQVVPSTTDASGNYSLQATSGTYVVEIGGSVTGQNIPPSLTLRQYDYSLTQSKIIDIIIPAKRTSIQVQDDAGNSVSNVALKTNSNSFKNSGLFLGGDLTNGSGNGNYDGNPVFTDASGNATMWLIPTDGGSPYHITATPPAESDYSTTIYPDYTAPADANLTITLQQAVTLSGRILDPLGNPIPNLTIQLQAGGSQVARSTTTSSGNYFLKAVPGSYLLEISGSVTGQNIPPSLSLKMDNYSLTQSKVIDITIPAKRINLHVQNAAGDPITNVALKTNSNPFKNSGLSLGGDITNARGNGTYDGNPVFTDASGNATMWLIPTDEGSPYHITATPPTGSPYTPSTLQNFTAPADTDLTITLQQPVTLNGRILDPLGNPLPNLTIQLQAGGSQVAISTTDASGNYLLQATSGTYLVEISGRVTGQNIPPSLTLRQYEYSLTQNKTIDITIPAKRTNIHIQDGAGNPVSNVALTTNFNSFKNSGLFLGGDLTNGSGNGNYDGNPVFTNESGDVTMWLIPTDGGSPYTIIATPPANSPFAPFSLPNITAATDQDILISLQYNHDAPVTTATLETQHANGTYSNPTIVTLSATAASGYTVANTYYTVDGGAQQTYSAPFNVFEEGSHTITYWSVDNSGVPEAPKTKTFTIYVNKAPHVNPLADASLNQGGTYSATGSFTDSDSESWTATVDYGDGAGPEPLTLNPDKTFSLNHQYTVAGTYTVTVVVRDDQQATGTTMTNVNVNGPPQIGPLSGGAINKGGTYSENGSFVDADSSLWVASVDYGDGSGEHPLDLNGTNFTLNHTYNTAGEFTVTVKVADSKGAYDSETTTVTVNAPPAIAQLNGASINKGSTYTESGSFIDDDSTSWTATVNYGDESEEEQLFFSDKTFSLNHLYSTAGTFTVTVKVTDNQRAEHTQTTTVFVNGEPQLNPLTSASIPEGTTYTSTGSFTDADSTGWNATVDYGDNSGVQPLTINPDKTFSLSHLYKDNGTHTITVTVTDNQGLKGTGTAIVTVNNLPAEIGAITAPTAPIAVNTQISASVSFTDDGILDTHTAVWHWGDGTTSTGTITESNGSGSVSGTHTYTAAGVYGITIEITDNNGGVATPSEFRYVTIYDPSGAGLSGSKEFISPVGAVLGNLSATGKADFGIEAKYNGAGTVPSGKAKLSFPIANIEFESLSYEWLVVIGSKAILKGDGMLNGISGYTFLISAIDGSLTGGSDYIRYQIKDPSGNVVYDTQPGAADIADPTTAVTKGKIKIQ